MDDLNRPLAQQFSTAGSRRNEAEEAFQDFRLTTAEILYRVPEYPDLLQSYLWQSLDRIPDFPKLNQFLSYWEKTLDGKLDSVRIGYVGLIQPSEWRFTDTVQGVQ